MSLKKKDPSLRVAANDPHLVSLGGGRLSTAVTIHNIPIGDMTIGSSTACSISLNGSGIKPMHCTLYRSEQNEVTLVPENSARVLIDGNEINKEINLFQGAMITIGNSNYLRFNNPDEAELIKSKMDINDRISMPQIDFSQTSEDVTINSKNNDINEKLIQNQKLLNSEYSILTNYHSPKVFTSDSITVPIAAKDVLGPKYESFTRNLSENNKMDKKITVKNNEIKLNSNYNYNFSNISSSFIQNSPNKDAPKNKQVLSKINNYNQISNNTQFDKYPKMTYGLQIYPMSKLNSEINFNTTSSTNSTKNDNFNDDSYKNMSTELDEIVKVCTEYEREHQFNVTNSPIVQNRIKTNGSLPRDQKKSQYKDMSPHYCSTSKTFFPAEKPVFSSGYENVKVTQNGHVEIGYSTQKSGYENVDKFMPQSPRVKIRTTCMSPKKEQFFLQPPNSAVKTENNKISNEYAQLIQSFEDKLKLELKLIKESMENNHSKNILIDKNLKSNANNNIEKQAEINEVSSEVENKKQLSNLGDLKRRREFVLTDIRKLKTQIAEVQRQEDEIIRELDLEKALVTAEINAINDDLINFEKHVQTLQGNIYRLEAERNSNRVMQETQQQKLKQSIEMKQDQVNRLKSLSQANPLDDLLKEELLKCNDMLENDSKTFEDLEFQYLEEETEWLAYREELNSKLKQLTNDIEDKNQQLKHFETQKIDNQATACNDSKTLENNLFSFLTLLEKYREELKDIDKNILEISGQPETPSDDEENDDNYNFKKHNIMSQSLFEPTDIACSSPKINLLTQSVNENMFFNSNKIEMFNPTTSTPKKDQTNAFIINKAIIDSIKSENNEFKNRINNSIEITTDVILRQNNNESDSLLKLKYNIEKRTDDHNQNKYNNLNLSLGSDDFEVNPIEKRVASQDDIDRICKVALDAPISTQGANDKVFESFKEIERNRQLLLAQQGSHVIEHERQKMLELKKKCHDEAKAQYKGIPKSEFFSSKQTDQNDEKNYDTSENHKIDQENNKENKLKIYNEKTLNLQRFSHPELESQRPLSQTNYERLTEKQFKSNTDLHSTSYSIAESESMKSSENAVNDKLISGSRRNLQNKQQRPLTRYLPIMSPYLDLKLHIESAGHQIALCPHVFIDSLSCRGYLHKLGSTFHTWSRRWFVLDRQKRALIYYADKSEKKPRGGACFATIDEVYLDHMNTSKSGRPHCTFIVKTKKRIYNLQAASDAAARIWIDAIITGAQGNIDYD